LLKGTILLSHPSLELPTCTAMKICSFALCLSSVAAMSLTKDNWDAASAGKSVFVKFQAPW